MSLLDDFDRVSPNLACPICGKPDWCLVAKDRSKAICKRAPSPHRWRDAGWLHRLRDEPRRQKNWIRRRTVRTARPSRSDLPTLAHRAVLQGAPQLGVLAEQLGLHVETLQRLGVGLHEGNWTFPMRNGRGEVVGIRLRRPDGSKFAVTGGREGLFIPSQVPDPFLVDEPLLLPEGPTDTAALLGLGFHAIGRPNNSGGGDLLVELLPRRRARFAVVVADADAAGVHGATAIASRLRIVCLQVRVIRPPAGIKDARAWVGAGGRREDVLGAIREAPNCTLCITSRGAP